MRTYVIGTLVLLALGLTVFFNAPILVDGRMNTVIHPPVAYSCIAFCKTGL